MTSISPTEILIYYDGVQVFAGRDPIGGHYVGMILERMPRYDRFMVTGVRPERLRQFRSGTLDLRTLFLEAPGGKWYIALTNGDPRDSVELEPQEGSIADADDLLPLEGLTLHDGPIDDLAMQEARARHNVVFEFSIEPPEAAEGHRVGMNTLARLLLQIQSVVKFAYQRAVRDLSSQERNAIDARDGYLMDVVVPAAPGSYRVILEAAKPPDKFGYGVLALGLQRLDEVFASAEEPDLAQEILQKHKGRLAGSYIKLMKLLSANNTGLNYSWAYPGLKIANYGGVSGADARWLAVELSDVSIRTTELADAPRQLNVALPDFTRRTTESVTLVGAFEQVNRRRGDWGLLTDDGGVKTGSIAEGGPELDGLEVGKRYRFQCREDTELDAIGGEKHILYLISFEPA